MQIEQRPTQDLKLYTGNPRRIPERAIAAVAESIKRFSWIQPIVVDGSGEIIAGHTRHAAAIKLGMESVPVFVADHLTPEQVRLARLADNRLHELSGWDKAMLGDEIVALLGDFDVEELRSLGFEDEETQSPKDPKAQSLSERFLVPPFSVLDARQEYWQARKREWLGLGIESELGRGEDGENRLTYAQGNRPAEEADATTQKILEAGSGTSIFDPVLCELAYRWFAPPGGLVLDPFAGGSVRGIVASRLGRRYIGIELRPEQVEANREQAARICRGDDPAPIWIEGDAADIRKLVPADTAADFLFSCPPYGSLERYSDDARDLSTMDHDAFVESYHRIIADTCSLLRDDRFACFVTGDYRDARGNYARFPDATRQAFADGGCPLYNEAILVTAIGSLPLRAGTQFARSRKLGKTHQNVHLAFKGDMQQFRQTFALRNRHANVELFVKGNARTATDAIGEVQVGPVEQPTPDTEAAPQEVAA
ncbi:MAG: ParB N-terminal domain-containing protein [Planctomycetota bacterium]